MTTDIEIVPVEPGKKLDAFLRLPRDLYADDPAFVPPLDMMVKDLLTPKSNPFFDHAEVALFTAKRGGKVVGRISAQVDREHLKKHDDATGFFGFFDTIDDDEVGKALIEAAQQWLRAKGMKRMRGPLSLSINDESGTLVDGFEHPNVLLMPHHKPYQDRVAKAAGLEKAKDLYGFRWEMQKLNKRADRAAEAIAQYPEVRLREADFENEIDELIQIQDDAWCHNWGHVSMTSKQAKHFAKDLALLIDRRITVVAEINGELGAMCLAVPNLNEAIADLGGKLLPFGFAKLIYRLKVKNPKSGRLVMLGIKEKFRNQKRYGYLSMAMVAKVAEAGRQAGYEWGELGWTLEDNTPINLLCRAAGGKHYRTYRLYEQAIA